MSYRKLAALGLFWLVIPGSTFILAGYGIKKLLDWRKGV